MAYDFSLSNPKIKSWLDGNSSDSPGQEFLYLHEHPLIRPNFISQIEVLIHETGQHMLAKSISGSPAKRLVSFAETFATRLGTFAQERNNDTSEEVLESLRDLYQLCLKIKSL